MFENIRLDELRPLIIACNEDSNSIQETDLYVSFFNDAIGIQKNKLLLNTSFSKTAKGFKRSKVFKNYEDVLSGRLGKLLIDLKKLEPI
jgi:hypothetical protein